MKKKLLEFEEIHILKRNEKLNSNCCYIINSESVARNTYFETKRDIIRAHKLVNRHLSPIMDIIDYLFTPSGWIFVVKIKSEDEILEQIEESGYKSKKMKLALRLKAISIIISECIRYTISGMARISNRYNRRGGAIVRCNFSRFIFDSIESAIKIMSKMKREEIKLCHQRKRYRPSLKWYDEEGDFMKSGDVFLCTRLRRKVREMGVLGEKCVQIVSYHIDVLHKEIKRTFNIHFGNFQPPKTRFPTNMT